MKSHCPTDQQRPGKFLRCALAFLLAGVGGCGRGEAPETIEIRRPEVVSVRPEPHFVEPTTPVAAVDLPSTESTHKGSELGRGLIYKNERVRNGPWSVNVLKIDRSRSDLEITTTFGRGRTIGLSALSEQVQSISPTIGHPLAAVNGDFYRTEHHSYAGDPRGLQIAQGELISAANGKTAFWVDMNGNPHMDNVASKMQVIWPDGETTRLGLNEERDSNDAVLYTPRVGSSTRARGGREFILTRHEGDAWLPLRPGQTYKAVVKEVREGGNSRLTSETMVISVGPTLLARVPKVKAGSVIEISTATSPDLSDAKVAIGGGPMLVHEGKVPSIRVPRANERHPRSAVGWNDDYFFFAQVDGRQHGFSVGMTLTEFATYLAKQGCKEVMNLDGGGSSEMWIEGEVVNRPCYGHERDTANGVAVVRRHKVAAQ